MPLERGRARDLFDECKAALGLEGDIALMAVAGGRACSPCACGIISPCVYIDMATASLPDEKLRYIFIHELSHIRLHHPSLKLILTAVRAMHWYNPFATKFAAMVGEDCELACDRRVLECLGPESGDGYMYTILETARRICTARAYTGVKALGGGLFLSEVSEKRFMERRYANMKRIPEYRHPKLAIVLTLVVCLLFGATAIAACGLPDSIKDAESVTVESYTTGSDLLDEGIRAYYGINSYDPITPEMLDGVKTIEFRASDILVRMVAGLSNNTDFSYNKEFIQKAREGVFVEFVINGRSIGLIETTPSVSRFEGTLNKAIYDYNQTPGAVSEGKDYYKKWNAFYTKRDPSDPSLSDEDRAQLIAMYPETLNNPSYFFDPYSSERECVLIMSIAYEAGLLDVRYLEGGVCDASALATLHNLDSAVFTGITPVNFDDTLTVRSAAETEPLEGSAETAPVTEVYDGPSLTTGSALLDEGIRAYFGINDGDSITADMLSGILTLKISADKLIGDCFPVDKAPYAGVESKIREKLDSGIYVSFVINGKTIGTLESYVYKRRFDGTILTALKNYANSYDDVLYDDIFKRWSALYTYKDATLPGLTDRAVNELYATFPETRNYKLYVLDPSMIEPEAALMLKISYGAGLLDNKYLPGGMFDVSALDKLPRLMSVSFEGVSLTGSCAIIDT